MITKEIKNKRFCKLLDEEYEKWCLGQKAMFLSYLAHELTLMVRCECYHRNRNTEMDRTLIGNINEIQHHLCQSLRDMLFATSCINGSGYAPGNELYFYLVEIIHVKEGGIQRIINDVLVGTNRRINYLGNCEKEREPGANPLFRGLPMIDTTALKIDSIVYS